MTSNATTQLVCRLYANWREWLRPRELDKLWNLNFFPLSHAKKCSQSVSSHSAVIYFKLTENDIFISGSHVGFWQVYSVVFKSG